MAYLTASERRSLIVEAAARVIARDGLAAATTRRIADEAGVNLAALHYSFDGKDEIYAAVDELLRSMVVISGERAKPGSTRREIVRSLLGRFQDLFRANRGIALAQYELLLWALRTPGKSDLAADSYHGFTTLFVKELREAIDLEGADPMPLARYTFGAIDGIYLQNLAAGTDGVSARELDAISAAVVEIVDSIQSRT